MDDRSLDETEGTVWLWQVVTMKKARDLVGLPVMELAKGEHVGEVRDILFTPEGAFHSLLLEKGGLLSASKILEREQIQSLGQDAIVVADRRQIREYRDEIGLIRSLLEGEVHFVGKDVLTENGNLFGTVEDVYLDEELRTIIGYEISEGFIVDLKEGRKVLPAHPAIRVGADALLVPDHIEPMDIDRSGI